VGLVLLVAALAFAAPAVAAPEWGIEMAHANAYGQQAGECPGGSAKYVPGKPEEDCGVDPFTGSGTDFDRGSGDNEYTITVKNTAPPTIAGAIPVGQTLSCETGSWEDNPTFSYHWLRNGNEIPGAEAAEYTVGGGDEGTVIQCQVTGTNAGSANSDTSPAVTIAPAMPTQPPSLASELSVSNETATVAVGSSQTCAAGEWTGRPTFAFQWLRNGAPIPGAATSTYVVVEADKGTSLQCEVLARNAGGTVVAENRYFVMVAPEPTPFPPYVEVGKPAPSIPVPPPPNEARGTVTVADHLPPGLTLEPAKLAESGGGDSRVSGAGWSCLAPTVLAFTCTRSDGLAPEEAYPSITATVHVSADAADAVTNSATVGGGGASSATAVMPTTTATVPFGISSLQTSVTNDALAAFTQAGGHPFSANSTFVLNYVPSDVAGLGLLPAGGTAPYGQTLKEAEAELTPGFVGNPQDAKQCTTPEILVSCPAESIVGYAVPSTGGAIVAGRAQPFHHAASETSPVWNLAPAPGHAAEFGFIVAGGVPLVLQATVRSDGNYGITIGNKYVAGHGPNPLGLSLTLCSNGVTGSIVNAVLVNAACAPTPQPGITGPFLTTPTNCSGRAPETTMRVNSWEDPAVHVAKSVYNGTSLVNGAPSLAESFTTGCNLLMFNPEVEFGASLDTEGGTTQADEPTGATFALKVPQTNKADENATPALKDATVTLPEGMTVDPSAADGLHACSSAQFGLGATAEPAEPAACPLGSQIGTVKVVTPLLKVPLAGQVFIGEPECAPCSNADAEAGHVFRLFLQSRSVERGVTLKLAGKVTANPTTGRLQATFTQQPQLPFSELLLRLNGGARAPLANPQMCGRFTTSTDLTPWSAPGLGGLAGTEAIAGTPNASPSSPFKVEWDGAGGACPASLPFGPFFSAGSQVSKAGASSPFSATFGREDREQDVSAITVSTPPGLLGKIAGIPRCPEAQANAGSCGPGSQIGTTTVGAGPGPHPFYLGGKVYLTGPYKGQPFGLSIVVPAIAGPFNLGTVVVRASIAINPSTASLTVTSDSLPRFLDGVQLRLRRINLEVNRPGFMLNPTNCAARAVGSTISGAQGASSSVDTPFAVGGCASLPFSPSFAASTQGKTSKANGASLTVTVKSATGQANIGKVDLQLPKALPPRLSTLQKACPEAQFKANPAGCPEASDIGMAKGTTPILSAPLTGPAYLVSHGAAAFPDIEFVLQGEGVEIDLDGKTDIKKGITYSRFETVPDAPISLFEARLPEGPHSILTTDLPTSAKRSLCGRSLTMPTVIAGQNGIEIKQSTKVAVTGCKASKLPARAQLLAKAIKACKNKPKRKRASCVQKARKRYGGKAKAKNPSGRGT
jgi:hypothetical protein